MILDEIPKGATGKLQRIGLAAEAGARLMRVAIFGAGAIGGYLGAKLAAAGRRRRLARRARRASRGASATSGLTLIEGGSETTVAGRRPATTPPSFGVQDYVVLTLKAHSVPPALDAIAPLLGPDTAVVTMQNGVPWWYFYRSAARSRARGSRRSIPAA